MSLIEKIERAKSSGKRVSVAEIIKQEKRDYAIEMVKRVDSDVLECCAKALSNNFSQKISSYVARNPDCELVIIEESNGLELTVADSKTKKSIASFSISIKA